MTLSRAGEVMGTSDGKTVRLTTSSRIHPGETVAVSAGGRLELLLLPGVLVELTGNTEIEIKQLRLARDGDETIGPMTAREAKVRLVRGTLIGSVGHAQMRSKILELPYHLPPTARGPGISRTPSAMHAWGLSAGMTLVRRTPD